MRLTDVKDITSARSYFGDKKRHAKHFMKFDNTAINVRNIAYVESKDEFADYRFNARIADSFVKVTLAGADAENFRKKLREF